MVPNSAVLGLAVASDARLISMQSFKIKGNGLYNFVLTSEVEESSKTNPKKNSSSSTLTRHPDNGPDCNTNFDEAYCKRLEVLNQSPREFVNCFNVRRLRMLQWIWSWIDASRIHDWKKPTPEGLEQFLAAGERLFDMRKQKKSQAKISQVAADYIIHQRGPGRERYIKYFVGQVLWSFYERYPKAVPCITKDQDSLRCAIESILSFPDSDLSKVIPEIAAFVPAVASESIDDAFGNWSTGTLYYLCRRVLNLSKQNKEPESAHTIKIRKVLAPHCDFHEKRELYAEAMELSTKIHGPYHYVTWELTECLGKFFLTEAPEYILNHYFHRFQGNKVNGVRELYERFLHGLRNDKDEDAKLLKEEIAPVLAEFYMEYNDDRKGRILLWEVSEKNSSQLYNDNWVPFNGPRGLGGLSSRRLIKSIHAAENLSPYLDFKYSSLEICIFPFEKVLLTAVEPSEEEKKVKWHPVWEKLPVDGPDIGSTVWLDGLEGGYEPKTLREADSSMVLQVPYLTYRHFESSELYHAGRTYESYRKGSVEQPSLAEWRSKIDEESRYSIFFHFQSCPRQFFVRESWPDVGGILVDPEQGQIKKYIYDNDTGALKALDKGLPDHVKGGELNCLTFGQVDRVPGFFNNTPGDTAILDHSQVAGGLNLISTDWGDWKRFVLHKCDSGLEPKILSTDGTPLLVLGYIYGSWVDFTLSKKWTGLQVYVVRARFNVSAVDRINNHSCHFVLNPDNLCGYREYPMSAEEARSVCSFLNPSLLRVMHHSFLEPFVCTMAMGLPDDFKGVTVDGPGRHSNLITELSRRAQWDNQFTETYWDGARLRVHYDLLDEQMKTEAIMRKEWNARYSKAVKTWTRQYSSA
ncbi:hypothetical protein B7463_g11951, partial [Scytalidium lignicola]